MKLFIIMIRWKGEPKPTETGDALLRIGSWLRYTNDVWLIRTNFRSDQIPRRINRNILGIEEVIIFELNRSSRAGWSEKWIWEWIDAENDEKV
jgi:hypothetical protein